jgi:glycosyltransferase involved in cell wall biosynthesis
MKIVINTNYSAAATPALITSLSQRLQAAGHSVTRNDWTNYQSYNLVLFMSPDSEVRRAKQQNPRIKTGIMDPKIAHSRLAEMRAADFLTVTSLEHRDQLLKYNPNIFVYYSLPDRPYRPKQHQPKEKIIIGYHGNKEHLLCFYPYITRALEKLARTHPLELWAIYNLKTLGRWTLGLPKNVTVRHLQWHENIYAEELTHIDIGIANNLIPFNETLGHTAARFLLRRPRLRGYPYSPHDYLYRSKYSSNPGRIYEFTWAGIPAVADYYPSASQVILDGVSGFIVNSPEGWHWALKQLADSPALRQTFAVNSKRFFDQHLPTAQTFSNFHEFILNLR